MAYIDDIDPTAPLNTDPVSGGADEFRQLKTDVQGSFPSLGQAAVTKTAEELNNTLDSTGDTMTGDLLIEKATPLLTLDNTSGTSEATLSIVNSVDNSGFELALNDNNQLYLRRTDADGTVIGTVFNTGVSVEIVFFTATPQSATPPVIAADLTRKDYVDTPSTAGDATAGLSVDDVGTYAFLRTILTPLAPGDTIAGSSLFYTNAAGTVGGGSPTGTWQCMGDCVGTEIANSTTLFLKVS